MKKLIKILLPILFLVSCEKQITIEQPELDLNGEEVYCTDCLGSNGSAGAKQHYQASTSSWRTFTTF